MTREGIMTKTIDPDQHDFITVINGITEQIPDTGFDGLRDLLLLFNDYLTELPHSIESDQAFSGEKLKVVESFFVIAKEHLLKAPEQTTINNLINHITMIAEDLLLDDEDIALIRDNLMRDQASASAELSTTAINQPPKQLKLFLQQAELLELSGIQDILYMVDEWLQEHSEEDNFPDSSKPVLKRIFEATQAYLSSAGDQTANCNLLIRSLEQLDETLQLEEEDSELLINLLLEESAQLSPVQTNSSTVEVQSIIGSNEESIQDYTTTTPDNYRKQLKILLQQSETKELNGILDVLYLVDEWLEEHSINASLAESSARACDEIVIATRDYLSGKGDQAANCNTLINNLASVDETLRLEEEDSTLLSNLLLEESTHIIAAQADLFAEEAIDESPNQEDAATLSNYREQLKLSLQQAETAELSGIQDILYLLDEWLEEHLEDKDLSSTSITTCSDIVNASQAYISGTGDQQININILISRINTLHEEPLLDGEDSQLLLSLLSEEARQIHQSLASSTKTQVAVDKHVEQQNNASSEITDELKEYLDILSILFLPIQTSLNTFFENQQPVPSIDENALQTLQEDLLKLTTISQTAEFIGLHQSSQHVQSNQSFLKNQDTQLLSKTLTLFHQWSDAVSEYLQAPLEQETIQKLLVINCSPLWPVVMDEQSAENLLTEFQSLGSDSIQETEERQRIATENDVSLALPDDVSSVLVDSLLVELAEQTATFSAAVEQLSQGGSMDNITVAQRVAHTLKGAGNTVGVKGIANLTHHLEDILTALANANTLPNKSIIGTLQRASDCLEEMTEALTNNSPPPIDAKDVLQEIIDVARRIDDEGIAQLIQEGSSSSESAFNSTSEQQPGEVLAEESSESGESEQMIRLPVSVVDKLLQASDEMMINNGQLNAKLKQALVENKVLQAHLEQFHYHSMELLGLVDMQRIHQIQNQAVNSELEFDSLEMDQYNELYSTSLRIHEMTSDTREMNRGLTNQLRDIDALLVEQGYLNSTSQTSLMDIRTIPVQSIVSRLQRGVRQAARMSGKKVELHLRGQDLLVDRDVLNNILDPLMHLLRNAVGHGIEEKEARVKAGKSEQGHISLSFYRERNMIAIDCSDDGGGLNLTAIKNKALKIGMITEGSELSDDELKQLIMQANFSTQDRVSQISGRGVGMDAVNSGIRALGGTLRLESETGKGCSFHILLPLSLAHHNCFLVNVGTQVLALANLGIEQVLLADAGRLYTEDDQYWFDFDDKKYTVKTIESLLSRVHPDTQKKLEARIFLLVNQLDNYFAIAVESIKNVKELIVKELDDVLPHIHGVIGASLLDDGSIAPVMDLQELLQQPSRWGSYADDQLDDHSLSDQTSIMVVDDSLSARRSLQQFFSDMGYQVMAARDGLAAIDQLEQHIPDIIVTDLEMPRLNGIELIEYLRRTDATKDLPVIMISSRATAKHKMAAKEKGANAYLAKPYSEDELSSTVIELLAK